MPPRHLLRWPPHWPKPRVSLVLAWAVALLFIGQWIWVYDSCRAAEDFAGSRFLCLVGSFYAALVAWLLGLWAIVIVLVERLLP